MIFDFEPELLDTLNQHIESLERSNLEGVIPDEFDLADVFDNDGQAFFSIQGLSDFWSSRPGVDFGQHITDLIVGAHNQRQVDLVLLLVGTPRKLSVLISLGTEMTTRTMLEGILPSIILRQVDIKKLLPYLPQHFQFKGILTGIPGRKASSAEEGVKSEDDQEQPGQKGPASGSMDANSPSQLERVVRGMHGATWAYLIQAHPRPRHIVSSARLATIDLLASITSRSKLQWQSTQQDSRNINSVESASSTKTFSGESVNYRAQYLIKLLEREMSRLDQAAAAGQWTVRSYFGASKLDDAQRLASLLMGTFAGKQSRPDPLRTAICQEYGTPHSVFSTYLSSEELAILVQLPREEVPGYAIHDHVRFDVDFRPPASASLPLGHIQQNGRDLYDTYNISLDALTKHAVVVGVTGSGKTTTVMNLLDSMVEANKPFLVIEPAKTEYRALRHAFAGRADLRAYTLGNETIAPFRLNPFEFETNDDPESSILLTHIDFLKAVFNAAFVLYSPMPHVLEDALHEVYTDKGWDIASGMNTRVPDWSDRHLYPIFPTLSDLFHKIDIVTDRLGYHHEVESNVKAGLKSRVGSLLIGSKGLMLDTSRGISMAQLLSVPTILELESIGNDDEKTFLMGLFLARLYEHRRMQASTGTLPPGLQHLIVFEEAHRLLKNTSTQVDSESSNMRAQAIEVFTNMLSEIRAYGQGVLVAEQIPSKLAPDVLKNTNMKIVHRLIAQDDRESIGQTMNLNAKQITHLGVLVPGMAAIYAEGADHAYLVRLENYKRNLKPWPDTQLKQVSPIYASVKSCQAIQDIERYNLPLSPYGGPDASIYLAAGKQLTAEKSKWLWANIFLRIVHSRAQLLKMVERFSEHIEAEMPYLSSHQHDQVRDMVIVRGSAEMLNERGGQYGWQYGQVEELRIPLTRGLLTLIRSRDLEQAEEDLDIFTNLYQELLRRRQGPFVGCVHCPSKCLYRSDVEVLLSTKDQERVEGELTKTDHASLDDQYEAVAWTVSKLGERWLGDLKLAILQIGYCSALHVVARGDYTEYEQALVGDYLDIKLLQESAAEIPS